MATHIKLRHEGGLLDLQIPLGIVQECCCLEEEMTVVLSGACRRLGGKIEEKVQLYAERKKDFLSLTLQTAAMGGVLQRKLTQIWTCEVEDCRPEEVLEGPPPLGTELQGMEPQGQHPPGSQPSTEDEDGQAPWPDGSQMTGESSLQTAHDTSTALTSVEAVDISDNVDLCGVIREIKTELGLAAVAEAMDISVPIITGDISVPISTGDGSVLQESSVLPESSILQEGRILPEGSVLPPATHSNVPATLTTDQSLLQTMPLKPATEGDLLQTESVAHQSDDDDEAISGLEEGCPAVEETSGGNQDRTFAVVEKLDMCESEPVCKKLSSAVKTEKQSENETLSTRRSARRAALTCPHCGKADFRGKSALEKHLKICSKTAKKRKKNEKKVAAVKNTFACSLCDSKLSSKDALEKHVNRVHSIKKSDSPLKPIKKEPETTPGAPEEEASNPPLSSLRCPHCARSWYTSHKHYHSHVSECHENPANEGQTGTKPHVCETCHYATVSADAIKRHRREVHGIKSKRPKKQSEYKAKLQTAVDAADNDPAKLQCPYCERNWFVSQMAFSVHFKDCYEAAERRADSSPAAVKPYQCEDCKTRFTTEITMRRHRREVHKAVYPRGRIPRPPKKLTPESPSICQFCGRSFLYAVSLKAHIKYRCKLNPDVTKGHYCTICNQIFTDKEKLTKHIEDQHPDGVQYICHLCGLVFRSRSGMYFHRLRKHSENSDLKHPCPVCGKRFDSNVRMLSHKTKHFDERNYTCETCGKSFKNPAQVKNHIKSVHNNQYTYRCDKCGHGMQKKKYLEAHVCGRVRRSQGATQDPPAPPPPPVEPALEEAKHYILADPGTTDMSGQVGIIVSAEEQATEHFNVQIGRLNEHGQYEFENVATFSEVEAATQYIQHLDFTV